MDPEAYLQQLRSRVDRKPAPKPLAGLLAGIRKSRKRSGSARVERIRETWRDVAQRLLGPEAAAATEVSGHAAGELRIAVTSHPLAQELQSYRSNELLAELNKSLGGKDRMARIRFRSGRVTERRSGRK